MRTDLKGTDLKGTDLKGTDLKGTDPKGSDLKGSDLKIAPASMRRPRELGRVCESSGAWLQKTGPKVSFAGFQRVSEWSAAA